MSLSGFSVHSAAQNNQLSLLKALLDENPSRLNEIDQDGRTPLHWASATHGGLEIVQYLLSRPGIEVDKTDGSGWTALHIACKHPFPTLHRFRRIDSLQASAGRESVVRELLGAGANPNKTNDKGLTPLHYAASKSHISIGQLLISRGADINAKDKANQHPLHRAATTGSVGFISILLDPPPGSPKTRLNTADRIGNTPLHLAMESGHGEAAVKLIEAGADRQRTNQDGQIPEEVDGVGGQEQKRVKEYVIGRVGKP
ncbi:hypothetical protein Clacol_007994 [Clathrus columnatus]|uniref:26S proteasome non-ATPase regulatory subunit 10 n=1 Tax=Clathrus columnatus TaxID=1419009 RepID=A0AAV5AM19_9AGAM|nr:hypothetical protein Clacol_007994 [Clathrus columnatus]